MFGEGKSFGPFHILHAGRFGVAVVVGGPNRAVVSDKAEVVLEYRPRPTVTGKGKGKYVGFVECTEGNNSSDSESVLGGNDDCGESEDMCFSFLTSPP